MSKKTHIVKNDNSSIVEPGLINELRQMIDEARQFVAAAVNTGLTMLYWRIGKRINDEILQGKRAEYGKEIIVTLSRQLSWSHFVVLIPIEKPLQRDFYAEMCRVGNWSVRTLRSRIDSMLFERTTLSKKPEELIKVELNKLQKEDKITLDLVLKDPYNLDFLGLKDRYLEKDLEDAILLELEQFLLELGVGFTFIARQKRIQIDNDDFYIDLLFYNRILKRPFAVDLKLRDFKADYKGQMELYLRWLDKHERQPGEKSPLRLILCAGKKKEQIELLELDKLGIHVAEYLTQLPPRKLLQERLQQAIEQARRKFEE
jgi:predicted nuclease of restriction endonuclease-like (RecB) superfamily